MKIFFRVILKIMISILSIIGAIMLIVNTNNFVIMITVLMLVIFLNVIMLSNPEFRLFKHKIHFKKIHKIVVPYEFKRVQRELKDKYNQYLEVYRRKAFKSIINIVISIIIEFLAVIFISRTTKININGLIGMAAIVPLFFLIKFIKYNKQYCKVFKETIVKELVKLVNMNLDYNYDGKDSCFAHYEKAYFEESEEYNSIDCTDYISGNISEGTNIEICNISLANRNEKGEKINNVDDFIFSYSTFNNYVSSQIIIRKNKYKINNKNRVELDSSVFEKYFDVFSESNILTMEILTHEVLEEIVDFYLIYKIQFEIIIRENCIYVKYITGKVFKPSILRETTNIQLLWLYYNILKFVIEFTLKINKTMEDRKL